MKHCPSPDCPHRRAVGSPAEFVDEERTTCSDCGTPLAEGAAPNERRALGPVPSSLRWRLAITLLAPAVAILASFVPVPGLDPSALPPPSPLVPDFGLVSVVHLGITPLILAALLVELAAYALPGWRHLRGNADGRRRLWRTTLKVALVLAALQAVFVVRSLQELLYGSPYAMPSIWVTLIAGTFGLIALAQLVRSRGLASGLALLTLIAAIPEARVLLFRLNGEGPLTPYGLVTVIGPLLITALATAWMLTAHRRLQARPEIVEDDPNQEPTTPYRAPEPRIGPPAPTIRLPASGLVPLLVIPASTLLAFYAGMAPDAATDATSWTSIAKLAAMLALGTTLALLWTNPLHLSKLWARATSRRWEPIDERRTSALRRPMLKRTLGYLLLLALLAQTGEATLSSLILVALATALAFDIRAEWQARHANEDLVPIQELHQVAQADAALTALGQAEIPAHARGIHFRSLLHSFAPFAPIELMVPRAQAPEASGLVGRLLH
jgi:hypothetical protein